MISNYIKENSYFHLGIVSSQMIDKINIALNMSKNTKENMGETARIHILRNFSKKNMLEKYFKFYQNINL